MDETDRIKRAVALGYDPARDTAPKVLAKGRGEVAERIMEIAEAHGIPLQQDPLLLELLAKVEIDQEIPPVLYKAVAEVLAFIYQLKGKTA
jgi:flagellar biosynthesis protein